MQLEDFLSLKGRKPEIVDKDKYRQAAVMLPLIRREEGITLLFEVRSNNISVQPGEISFPGGHVEPEDKGHRHTAVRETCEELGITEDNVEVIAPLDILITPFYTLVTPYLGLIKDPDEINFCTDEVADVFEVPLDYFLQNPPKIYKSFSCYDYEKGFPFHSIPNAEYYESNRRFPSEVYFYYYNDKVIWGITARLTANLIEIIETL